MIWYFANEADVELNLRLEFIALFKMNCLCWNVMTKSVLQTICGWE